MNLTETNQLLRYLRQVDNRREADDAVILAWQSILADVDPGDAREAARRHYATSTDYLMPVHICNGAAELVRARRRAARELAERQEQLALAVAPRTDRRAEIIAGIRAMNPVGDVDKLFSHRAYWRREAEKLRPRPAEPNPWFTGFQQVAP